MLIYIEEFTVVGLTVRTMNSDEFNPEKSKLPLLWNQFYSLIESIPSRLNSSIFGVYSDYESDATGHYSMTAGVLVNPAVSMPNLSMVRVQAGDYLVFEGKGEMPQTVVETWKRVWEYFTLESDYQRSFRTDFEQYNGSDYVAIHIGVKPRQ